METWPAEPGMWRVAVAVADHADDIEDMGMDDDAFIDAIANAFQIDRDYVENCEVRHPSCPARYAGWLLETDVSEEEIVLGLRTALGPLMQGWDSPRIMIELSPVPSFVEAGPLSVLDALAQGTA